MGLTVFVSLVAFTESGGGLFEYALSDWRASGLIGYNFLHAGLWHLTGNMIALWVFGNAICGNTSNLLFTILYLAFGILAGCAHLFFSEGIVVGASGAISGIVGMATAMYPKNNVSVFWYFIIRFGTFSIPLWVLALIWLLFDLLDMLIGDTTVAVWAHIGGFFTGLIVGIVLLHTRVVTLTEWDHESLPEIFLGKQ